MPDQYQRYPVDALDAGLDYSKNPRKVDPAGASELLNIELHDGSLKSAKGSIKLNNQTVRRPGIRFSPDPALSPLSVAVGKSVPLRSYGYLPYNPNTDIGGDGAYSGAIASETCHFRRGSSFSFQISFRIPETEKLYEWETRGTGAPAESAGGAYFEQSFGYDEALDDTMLIIQKGGDGFSAPSWFLGITNIGGTAPDASSGSLELQTGYGPGEQVSNYHLVFGWYDSPAWAHDRVANMRYDLSDPSASASGEYPTQSFRALIINYAVEPGEEYHAAVQLRLDSETDLSGSSTWNDDGLFQVAVSRGTEKPRVFGYSRKNLLESTERFTQTAYWTVSNLTRTADWDVGTPLSTSGSVDLLLDTSAGSNGNVRVDKTSAQLEDGVDYTFSAYLQEGTAAFSYLGLSMVGGGAKAVQLTFNWSDLTVTLGSGSSGVGDYGVIDLGNGAYRVWAMLNFSTVGSPGLRCELQPDHGATTTLSCRMWGAQLEQASSPSTYEPNEGIWTWRGPTDGANYLTKYGTRFHGKDAIYLGLGMRFAPWKNLGFIPFGSDCTALEHGGYCMVDRSSLQANDLYGSAYDLTVSLAPGNAYASVSHESLVDGRTDGGITNPTGQRETRWWGLGNTSGNFNDEALRGYKLIVLGDSAANKGGIICLDTYSTAGAGDYRFSTLGAGTKPSLSATEALVQAFRWNQRSLDLSELRFYSAVRDLYDPRTQFSLRSEALLNDADDPDIENLTARYPLDDAEGGVLREVVLGADGYLAPFKMGTSAKGSRGEKQLFLSGEGEALHLDLSKNPVFLREFRNAMRSGEGGLAIEMTFTMPQAYYGINVDRAYGWAGTSWTRAKWAPYLATWEVKAPNDSGMESTPDPILALTHSIRWETGGGEAGVRRPLGFSLEVPGGSDQEAMNTRTAFNTFDGSDFVWNETGDWIGRRITLQFGIQSNGTEDSYDVYVSGSPARYLLESGGDLGDQEFTLFTSITILKRDLERSVITVGGCWNAKDMATGYTEANARMIVDEVRVFATAAPGALASSGMLLTGQDGKLFGTKCLPPRELLIGDLLQKPGEGVETANVVDGSTTVTASGNTAFFAGEPEDTVRSVKETYLLIAGDPHAVLEEETEGREVQEFYFIPSVASDGKTLTLATPFADVTRDNAYARVMRLVGYCSFGDDVRDKVLSLGQGATYVPGTTETDDAVISEDWFTNLCPVNTNWKMRIFPPIGDAVARFLPKWVRGLQSPRRGEILGLHPINERVLAGSQGSLFDVDDRWRNQGPTESFTKSLAFRGRFLGDTNAIVGLQDDRVVFPTTDGLIISGAGDLWDDPTEYSFIYDAWVELDALGRYQTIMQVTDVYRDPSEAATSRSHNLWIRLRDGFPQLCIGSSETYDGTNLPEDGLFVAEGAQKLAPGEETHVRWQLFGGTNGTVITTPRLQINGKTVEVSLNATGNGLSGDDWITVASLAASGSTSRLILGAARDSYRDTQEDIAFVIDELRGRCLNPGRFQGWLHGLNGNLSGVAVSITTDTTNPPANFNPHTIDYSTEALYDSVPFHANLQEGVGHKVYGNSTYGEYGVIQSHPFISEFHEMGHSDELFTFAAFGAQVFVANGGKVVVEEEGKARFAGVAAPTFAPSFEVVRTPLWLTNTAAVDPENNPDTGTSVDGDNDPVGEASEDDLDRLFHYSTRGNNYLLQAGHDEMSWGKQEEIDPATGVRSLLCFKALVRMRSTSGRQLLWSSKSEGQSGKALEIRNGKVGFVWWDNVLKKEVSIFTSQPVIIPGYVHYISFHKHYCPNHEKEGNWVNSIFTDGNYKRLTVEMSSGYFSVGELIVSGAKEGLILRTDETQEDGGTTIASVCIYEMTGTFAAGDVVGTASGSGTIQAGATPYDLPRDSLVVRRFRKADSSNAWETDTTFDAKTDETPNNAGTMSSVRNCISFTSDTWGDGYTTVLGNWFRANNMTASGCVSIPLQYSGAAGGVVNANTSSGNVVDPFHEDMKGMIWQWGGTVSATYISNIYRIKDVVSSTQIKVVLEEDGSVPDFSSISNDLGAVFTGIYMQKSEDFDDSKEADRSLYDTYLMGSPLQMVVQTGITPFDGEMWCPGWASLDPGDNYNIFEAAQAESCETGTDDFAAEVYTTPVVSTPGPLTFDQANGEVFTALDPEKASAADYATTQPNADLIVAPDSDESSDNAADMVWTTIDAVQLLAGKTTVWVTFYDPNVNEESNPSPVLVVVPSGEDDANLSGDAHLLLKGIPTSPGKYRRIYLSLLDQSEGFRVATIPDDTSTAYAIRKTQEEIARGIPMRRDLDQPPRCKLVAVSQQQMWYGNLDGQADGLVYSNPYEPQYVDYLNLFPLDTGDDEEITGLIDQQGSLIAGKRNALWRVQASGGVAVSQIISRGVGFLNQRSIASLDNFLYWVYQRGPMRFSGTGVPRYIGPKLEPYFRELVDPQHLARVSAGINSQRSQFVFTGRRDGDTYTNERIALQYDHELSGVFDQLSKQALHKITRYNDPNIVVLAEVERRGGGPRRLIGGSDDGFVYWLDEISTTEAGLGADTAVWGDRSLTADASATSVKLPLSGTPSMDTDLEGPRGTRIRWRDGTADKEAVVLFAESDALHLDRAFDDGNLPASGDALVLGSLLFDWRSKHFSFGSPDLRKKVYWLDFTRSIQSSGQLYVDVFKDLSSTAFVFPSALTLDLTAAVGEIPIGEAQFGRLYQIGLRTRADQVGVEFEILDMSLRYEETEPR